MPKLLTTLPLIAILMMSNAAFAQETETSDESAVDSTQAVEEKPDPTGAETGSLDLGEEVDENRTFVKATYGDWELKCFRSENQEELCQMYQLLREEAGNPVAEFSLYRLAADSPASAGATIVVPLGTLLPSELRLSVDGGRAKSYAYSFCSSAGCFARIGLSDTDLDAFKAGSVATLQIVPAQAPNQTVTIQTSLKGFTAAFDNVSTISN